MRCVSSSKFDRYALDAALAGVGRVATHRWLREHGVPLATTTRRIGPAGPWQRLLPGVVLAHRGTPTRRELLLGALAYVGPEAVITGPDALRALGARNVDLPATVHVLVPVSRQRSSFGFVQIERTSRMPPPIRRGGIPYAPIERATVDTCRRMESTSSVRALVSAIVQQRLCDAVRLTAEVHASPRQRTAAARRSLLEVSAGIRSVAEAMARDALRRFKVPEPLWNVPIRDADGVPLLTPDGWWPKYRAALEIDSVAWHLSPDDWRRTQQRQRRITTLGIRVLAFSPLEIIQDPAGFAREIRTLLGLR